MTKEESAWRATLAVVVDSIVVKAASQQLEIAREASARYRIHEIVLSQEDSTRLAKQLYQVQHQALLLGIQLAFDAVVEFKKQP